ncbi:MAG: aminopeptidase N [Chloroflexi bacterium]|nr:aminopeptidase N [Chloroflexota bacterium]
MNAPATLPKDVLTQIEAEARAPRIADVAYDLRLDLTRGASTYRGDLTATFRCTGDGPLFLDFTGKRIERLEVNGTLVDAPDWSGVRLTLDGALLAPETTVHVVYENDYDHTGDGFHQFVDPEDGEEYLYTNFEPYSAHKLFPCFDQPDVKATYRLTVTAPEAWELIANSRVQSRAGADEGRATTTFERTQRFSTYLFALIAGPFVAFRDEHEGIALGFFARKSLAPHVDEGELFEVTKQGLTFFAEFFDYPYPFGKYDQVFVPEFNAGAMENVGAVTHSERMVFRDPPTDTQRQGRAEVILHEMAHMWFGDLVTMRWWNDLWLNESFATYMAYLAMDESTRFTTSWQAFNSGMKNWAYRQDQLTTTHPIAGQVADTDATFLNFDGITYGKGASVIKQLVAAMGMEGFRAGMRGYFVKHAFGNTTLSQWLDALGEGVGRDLHGWAALWLETPSLNTIAATVEADGDRIAALTLTQSAPAGYPTLRPHVMDIALVRDEGGSIVVREVPARIDGATAAIEEAQGQPLPDLVFPNHHDHDFAKVALDERSLAFLRENLDRIEDPLLRQLIWQALWNMVRDQQLKSTEYLELAGSKVTTEADHELIETILATMSAAISRYVPEEQKAGAARRFFALALDALKTATDADMQITWARTLIGIAITPEDTLTTGQLADGAIEVPGLTIDQDMRWSIAMRYVAYGLDGAQERVDAEVARDPSDRGQRAALRCGTSKPDARTKAEAWARFQIGIRGYGSLHQTNAAMSGFHWWAQRDLLTPYVGRYFEALPGIFEREENEYATAYFGGLWPGYLVDRETLGRAQSLLASLADTLPVLQRSLRESIDDLERAVKCREYAAS